MDICLYGYVICIGQIYKRRNAVLKIRKNNQTWGRGWEVVYSSPYFAPFPKKSQATTTFEVEIENAGGEPNWLSQSLRARVATQVQVGVQMYTSGQYVNIPCMFIVQTDQSSLSIPFCNVLTNQTFLEMRR